MSILSTAKPASDLLADHHIKLLVYGHSGVGKTTLAATTGAPTLVLSAEAGLLSLATRDTDHLSVVEISAIEQLRQVMRELTALAKQGPLPYRWLVLDSISEIAEIALKEQVASQRGTVDMRRAYGDLATQVIDLVKRFRDLPCHVVLICKAADLVEEGLPRVIPKLPGQKLGQELPYLLDEVLCLCAQRTKEDKIKRFFVSQPDERFSCKDRSGKLDLYEPPDLSKIAAKILA